VSSLVPCSGCRQHVRATETVCPFCAAPVAAPSAESAGARSIVRRSKRAAWFALGASLAASACEDATNVTPIYGAPGVPEGGRAGAGGRNDSPSSGARGGSDRAGASGTGGSSGSRGASDEPTDAAAPPDAGALDTGGDGDGGDPSP
jgi:hypothetical protein